MQAWGMKLTIDTMKSHIDMMGDYIGKMNNLNPDAMHKEWMEKHPNEVKRVMDLRETMEGVEQDMRKEAVTVPNRFRDEAVKILNSEDGSFEKAMEYLKNEGYDVGHGAVYKWRKEGYGKVDTEPEPREDEQQERPKRLGSSRKIPQSLKDEAVKKLNEGATRSAIARWMKDQGYKMSLSNVDYWRGGKKKPKKQNRTESSMQPPHPASHMLDTLPSDEDAPEDITDISSTLPKLRAACEAVLDVRLPEFKQKLEAARDVLLDDKAVRTYIRLESLLKEW